MSLEELEDLVPDLLYGELDDERGAQVRAQVDKNAALAAKLASYESLRAAFQELPDEEPPAFISAQLMHEAAKHAGAAADAEPAAGVWATIRGWFAPVWAHPGVAAAASLAVLLGLGSILYMRGGDQIAQPDAPASRAVAPASATTTGEGTVGSAPAAPALQAAAEADEDSEAPNADPGERKEVLRGDEGGFGFSDLSDNKDIKSLEAAPSRTRKTKKNDANKPRAKSKSSGSKSDGLLDTGATGGAKSGAKGGPSRGAGATPSAPPPPSSTPKPSPAKKTPAPQQRPQPAPADAPPEAEAEPDSAGADDEAPAKSDDKPANKTSQLKALHGQAAAAAASGDCARVRTLGGRIEALDGTYYRNTFARDSRIKACLAR